MIVRSIFFTQLTQIATKFTWSTEKKASSIDVSDTGLLAGRTPTSVGHNPCIMASEPLTKERPCFRVQVLSIGKFVGVGLADSFLLLDRGVVLGRQPGCLNCAYFSQGPNIRKLRISMNVIFIYQC